MYFVSPPFVNSQRVSFAGVARFSGGVASPDWYYPHRTHELPGLGAAILLGAAADAPAQRRPFFSAASTRRATASCSNCFCTSRPPVRTAFSQASKTVPSGADRARASSSSLKASTRRSNAAWPAVTSAVHRVRVMTTSVFGGKGSPTYPKPRHLHQRSWLHPFSAFQFPRLPMPLPPLHQPPVAPPRSAPFLNTRRSCAHPAPACHRANAP